MWWRLNLLGAGESNGVVNQFKIINMRTKSFLLSLLLAVMSIVAYADSPLTSTRFAAVYKDQPIVEMALNSGGNFNTTILDYLADSKNPVDVRVAVINAAGWDFNGKSTGEQLFTYLCGRYKAKDEQQLAKKLDAGTLVTYAYAKAMSNYFTVDGALELAEKAVDKNKKKSFTVNFIASLIRAQKLLDSDWAALYATMHNVLEDGSLKLDMRQAAIDEIWDYIKVYENY